MKTTTNMVTATLLLFLGAAANTWAQSGEPLGSPGSVEEAAFGNRLAYAAMSLVYPDYKYLPVPLYGYDISSLNLTSEELESILEDARDEDVRAAVVFPEGGNTGGEDEPDYVARAIRVGGNRQAIIDSLQAICPTVVNSSESTGNERENDQSNGCSVGNLIAFSKPLREHSETQRFMASARLWSFDTSAE